MKLEDDHIVAHTVSLFGGALAGHGATKAYYAPKTVGSDPVTATTVTLLLGLAAAVFGAVISDTAGEFQ